MTKKTAVRLTNLQRDCHSANVRNTGSAVLRGVVRPMVLGFKTDEIPQLFTVGSARGL